VNKQTAFVVLAVAFVLGLTGYILVSEGSDPTGDGADDRTEVASSDAVEPETSPDADAVVPADTTVAPATTPDAAGAPEVLQGPATTVPTPTPAVPEPSFEENSGPYVTYLQPTVPPGGCPGSPNGDVTVTFRTDAIDPSCVAAAGVSQVRVVNQSELEVVVNIGERQETIGPGDDAGMGELAVLAAGKGSIQVWFTGYPTIAGVIEVV